MCHPNDVKTERKCLETTTDRERVQNIEVATAAGGANTDFEPELITPQEDLGIPTLPLIIGPYSVISTLETSSSNFIAPPYLVVEVDDDGMMHTNDDNQRLRTMRPIANEKRRLMWKWLDQLNPLTLIRTFVKTLRFIFKQ